MRFCRKFLAQCRAPPGCWEHGSRRVAMKRRTTRSLPQRNFPLGWLRHSQTRKQNGACPPEGHGLWQFKGEMVGSNGRVEEGSPAGVAFAKGPEGRGMGCATERGQHGPPMFHGALDTNTERWQQECGYLTPSSLGRLGECLPQPLGATWGFSCSDLRRVAPATPARRLSGRGRRGQEISQEAVTEVISGEGT